MDKVNAELVTLTYGTMVAQLCLDFDSNYVEVNKQLDKMGYNIGMRLVEDFFAKSGTQRCANLRETAETISKVCGIPLSAKLQPNFRRCGLEEVVVLGLSNEQIGFKIFLNITPTVANWANDNKQFSLIFEENPLADFVELPDDGRAQDELWYSNILCGVLRGALEMVCQSLFSRVLGGAYYSTIVVEPSLMPFLDILMRCLYQGLLYHRGSSKVPL